MKDKKLAQCKQIYVRIQDKKLADKYNEIKKTRREKVSDNEFAQELIKLGLDVLSANKDELNNFTNSSEEIKRLLGLVLKEVRKMSKDNSAMIQIKNKKSNAIYNLLVAQSLGQEVTETEIENGMYDELPERFVEELREGGDMNGE